ncbi:hypothetical protein DUNSADRAFT_17249 [Dunaliella salina]|uniref:Uncharacterized protein n=1 Tax=Dunaliella salina TaxID=3046 RepID=A0ABQ7H0A0_DUNSA|nr:hypothetical protein DUNSADRAFT_17249 [Dunaliella salina]KAF5840280.1 hypothetical protein DUNSADRAFT_17249 [Dunaliella salina]|eukprot:KAF5840279.1 hypothetical protein DUNSADRAFT_17249 [Dunaliella salina]
MLVTFLALLPALVYILAVVRIKEGHIVFLYQTTMTLTVVRLLFYLTLPGSSGPEHMYGLDILCLLFAAASAALLCYKAARQRIDDYVMSVFTSAGGSTWRRWIKIVLIYIGFCPLLLLILGYDTEGCCPEMAILGASYLTMYAMVCAICNAFESSRKTIKNAADAHAATRGELDGYMNEAAPEEERQSLRESLI